MSSLRHSFPDSRKHILERSEADTGEDGKQKENFLNWIVVSRVSRSGVV